MQLRERAYHKLAARQSGARGDVEKVWYQSSPARAGMASEPQRLVLRYSEKWKKGAYAI